VASAARTLICRNCRTEAPLRPQHACYDCFGPLEINYDLDVLRHITRADIEAGPANMWRYAPLLPVGQDPSTRVTLNPGWTPLVRADALADAIGLHAALWIKDDSANPTHSFKDRVVSTALTAARGFGFTRFACASTGNLANSVAAHAARAGVASIVFIPYDLEPGKVLTTAVYGGDVVAIEGSYDDVNRLCSELTETDEFEKTAFVNVNLRPYYAEGSRTLGYEVAEQLGWRIPAQVVIPMASGELLTKVDKAFTELVELGLADAPASGWKVFGAQSAGCNPIATRAARRHGRHRAGEADRDREVAQHRRPGRGPVRAGIGAPHRRLDGRGGRRRDPRRDPAAGRDHRDLRRDGRRRHDRGAAQADRVGPARPGC
jgi:threonine synthase